MGQEEEERCCLHHHQVKLMEQCTIAPPQGSDVTPSSLPLTFFDVLFLLDPPLRRILFYAVPDTSTFIRTHLPNLKHSLSLALQLFHPLAGTLVLPKKEGSAPEICCSGADSVAFTLAESGDDFYALVSDVAKDADRFYPLVPRLSRSGTDQKQPVFSVQVTLFPNHGVCVGICAHCAALDACSLSHFMKAWAAIARVGLDAAVSAIGQLLPLYDRAVVPDAEGLSRTFLSQQMQMLKTVSDGGGHLCRRSKTVRATLLVTGKQIEKLERWVLANTWTHCSRFSIVCGVVWASLVKVRTPDGDTSPDNERFTFLADCRSRLDPPIPPHYFGNCQRVCAVERPRHELAGDCGWAAAALAVGDAVAGLQKGEGGGVMRGAAVWLAEAARASAALVVAASPKFGAYGLDFGWGRPRKTEVVLGAEGGGDRAVMCLAENPDEEGAIEVGMELPDHVMVDFEDHFVKTLDI